MNNLYLDIETTGLHPYRDKIYAVGAALNDGPVVTLYTLDAIKDNLGGVLLDSNVTKVFHNANFDLLFLNRAGIKTLPPYFDTQIYWHLDNPHRSSKLKDLGEELLKEKVTRFKEVIGTGHKKKPISDVNKDTLEQYLKQDVELTIKLHLLALTRGISEYYRVMELPLIQLVLDAELHGIIINKDKLTELTESYGEITARYEEKFKKINLNPRSP